MIPTYTFIVSIFILIGLGLYQQAVGQISKLSQLENSEFIFYIEPFLLVVRHLQVEAISDGIFYKPEWKMPV